MKGLRCSRPCSRLFTMTSIHATKPQGPSHTLPLLAPREIWTAHGPLVHIPIWMLKAFLSQNFGDGIPHTGEASLPSCALFLGVTRPLSGTSSCALMALPPVLLGSCSFFSHSFLSFLSLHHKQLVRRKSRHATGRFTSIKEHPTTANHGANFHGPSTAVAFMDLHAAPVLSCIGPNFWTNFPKL